MWPPGQPPTGAWSALGAWGRWLAMRPGTGPAHTASCSPPDGQRALPSAAVLRASAGHAVRLALIPRLALVPRRVLVVVVARPVAAPEALARPDSGPPRRPPSAAAREAAAHPLAPPRAGLAHRVPRGLNPCAFCHLSSGTPQNNTTAPEWGPKIHRQNLLDPISGNDTDCGICVAKFQFLSHAPGKWLKSCGRCARLF